MIDRRLARALQIAVLLCFDAAISILMLSVARGHGAVFGLLGVGAAAGVLVAAVALVAVLARSSGVGGVALLLALLRLIAAPIAVGIVTVRDGAGAVVGLTETFVVVVAVLDAVAGLAAGVAANRAGTWNRR